MPDLIVIVVNRLRGHLMVSRDGEWFFVDTGEPTRSTWKRRPCGYCGRHNTPDTPDGHDGCMGRLPGVLNACCGHGSTGEAYVQLSSGDSLQGENALVVLARLANGEDPEEIRRDVLERVGPEQGRLFE